MTSANKIQAAFILGVSLILALWLGVSLVTNQFETLLKFAAVAMLLVCILLGRKIWLMFIFLNAFAVPLIRGFGTEQLGQAIFVGFTIIIMFMRRQPLKFKFTELEFWMLLLLATIAQVYLRNPVGLNIFGAGTVGAKPYFIITASFVTAVFLSLIVVNPKEIKWSMWLTVVGWFTSILGYKARGMIFRSDVYSGSFDAGKLQYVGGATRNPTFGSLSLLGSKILAAYRSPLKDIFHPLWGLLILLTCAFAAASGYRNYVASVGLFYLIAIAYRGGFHSVIIASFLFAVGLVLVAFINLIAPLPPNIQRALSPFPGTWEKRHVKAAQDSTDWRVDMWKEALFTDYWIKNKILGDGLGFTKREFQILLAAGEGENVQSLGSGMSTQQEAMMITGGYHSGPVQCVRITGYVGLAILLLVMIRVAVHAHRQILRCRGTEWYPVALFYGIPIIALPVIFVFVFGDFQRDVSFVFISIGMIRLLEKNLPLPAYVSRKRQPYVLMSHRALAAAQQGPQNARTR